MAEGLLADIGIGHYNAMFNLSTGLAGVLCLCDPGGNVVPAAGDFPAPLAAFAEEVAALPAGSAASRDPSGISRSLQKGLLLGRPLQRKDGEPLGWIAAYVPDPDGEAMKRQQQLDRLLQEVARGIALQLAVALDLDKMTVELIERYEESHLLYEIGSIVKSHGMGDETFQEMISLCIEYLNVELVAFLRSDSKKVLHATRPQHAFTNLDLLLVRLRGELFPYVKSSRDALVINDEDDPRRAFLCHDLPFKFLVMPIMYDNKVRGSIVMLRGTTLPDFNNGDRRLLKLMADEAGIILVNQCTYQDLEEFTVDMTTALIEAVDAKDPYTRGHSDRVNYYTMNLGQALGLSGEDYTILHWASLLHDLGKIAIPDVVLSKPGRLTSEEKLCSKSHAQRGYEILKDVDRLQKALPGIHHHHEWFDGSGYPDGLKGKNIPLHARIIAVADAYDAMTSSRSYREAMSHEDALREIRRVAGSQLDPDIVRVWIEMNPLSPDSQR